MKVFILNTKTKEKEPATISKLKSTEIPLKKNGWNFNWKQLFKVEGANFYKIALKESPKKVEGLLMLTIFNEEMVFMNNLELAPYNIGKKKIYAEVAGCLLAFACRESIEKGVGHYNGFLSFESKTELIELYQNKYGAIWAMGHKMYFDPKGGKKLIKRYLSIDRKKRNSI